MSTWVIDTNHSEITFKVKHLVISTVTGKFTSFDASAETSKDDFSDAKINFSADVFEINMGDRIAQMVVSRHEKVNWDEVEVLNETLRGEGGFGHTAVK